MISLFHLFAPHKQPHNSGVHSKTRFWQRLVALGEIRITMENEHQQRSQCKCHDIAGEEEVHTFSSLIACVSVRVKLVVLEYWKDEYLMVFLEV